MAEDEGAQAPRTCVWCYTAIGPDEEAIEIDCSVCDNYCVHRECLSDYLVNHDANSKSTMIRRKGHHLNDHLNVRSKKSPVSQARGSFCLRNKRAPDGKRCEDEDAACHGKMRDVTVHEPESVIAKRAKAAQIQQDKQKQDMEKQKHNRQDKERQKQAAALRKQASGTRRSPQAPQHQNARDPQGLHGGGAEDGPLPAASAAHNPHDLQLSISRPEEIEAAVHNKLLPATFRTSLCSTVLTDGVACPLGERCFNAHGLDELRTNAAINLKLLPMDYKLTLCEAYCNSGKCEHGLLCNAAHGVHELRVNEAIQTGWLKPDFKTRFCDLWNAGDCPDGEYCTRVHDISELRRETAVSLGVLPDNYKFGMCTYDACGTCGRGDMCNFAHGVADLRLLEAVRHGILNAAFRTEPCTVHHPSKQDRATCWRYHTEDERMSRLEPKQHICSFIKEGLPCPDGENCPYAHDVSEIDVQLISKASTKRRSGESDRESVVSRWSSNTCQSHAPSNGAAGGLRSGRTPSEAADHLVDSLPASVRSGRMPIAPGRKKKRHQGSRAEELMLCKYFTDMGRCPLVDCKFAHGEADLAQRKYEFETAKRAEQETKLEHETRARAELEATSAPERLSPAAQDAMRAFKVAACAKQLRSMGFAPDSSERTAHQARGDVELATSMLFDGGGEAGSNGTEVDVEAEEREVLSMACAMGVGLQDVEQALLDSAGNWELVLQKFQGMSLQADSAANGGGDVPPQIIGDVASESGQLPDVGDTQDAVPEDFWKPVETTPSDWITPSTNPEWFGPAAVAATAASVPAMAASAAAPSQMAAPANILPSTDVYGVGTQPLEPASAPAAVATPMDQPTDAFQFVLSDFAETNGTHSNEDLAAQQPPTPAQAVQDRGSGQLVASPIANEDEETGFDDLLAMLTA